MDQTWSNWFKLIKLDQVGINWIKYDQIGSNWIKLVQIRSNLNKLVQIGSNWIKLDQLGTNLIKLDQIGLNWIKLGKIGSNLKFVETWGWGLVPHPYLILCLFIFDYWKTRLKLVFQDFLKLFKSRNQSDFEQHLL